MSVNPIGSQASPYALYLQQTSAVRQSQRNPSADQAAQIATNLGLNQVVDPNVLSQTGQAAVQSGVQAVNLQQAALQQVPAIGEAVAGFVTMGYGVRPDQNFSNQIGQDFLGSIAQQIPDAISRFQARGGSLDGQLYLTVSGNELRNIAGDLSLIAGTVDIANGAKGNAATALGAPYSGLAGVILGYATPAQAAALGAPGAVRLVEAGGVQVGGAVQSATGAAQSVAQSTAQATAQAAVTNAASQDLPPGVTVTNIMVFNTNGELNDSLETLLLGGDPSGVSVNPNITNQIGNNVTNPLVNAANQIFDPVTGQYVSPAQYAALQTERTLMLIADAQAQGANSNMVFDTIQPI